MGNGYGEFIRKHRIASGFKSQRRLAEKTGISSATISRIESEIQKPELKTLQTLADYLKTTTLVELMVECGYWDKDELLEDKQADMILETKDKKYIIETKNEDEFIDNINLSDEDLLDKFDLKVDGKSLTEEETKWIIAYVRSFRDMNRR